MDRDLKAAAAAVEAAAGARGWNVRDLAAAADVDPATVTDFLAGRRWPRISTRGAIERALGWPGGSIATVAGGGAPPGVSSSPHEPDPLADIEKLNAEDREVVLAVARQLIAARNETAHYGPPDLSRVQGLRLAEEETDVQAPVRNGDG